MIQMNNSAILKCCNSDVPFRGIHSLQLSVSFSYNALPETFHKSNIMMFKQGLLSVYQIRQALLSPPISDDVMLESQA